MTYVSHARSAEELRQEVITDLNRRLDSLARQREAFARGAAGRARFDCKILVLEEMLLYWSALVVAPRTTKKKAP